MLCRNWPVLFCLRLCTVTQGPVGPLHRVCCAAPSVLCVRRRTAWCCALHCTCGQWAVGSGTSAMHCHTAWGQWAVQLLLCTASLPVGSGQWSSCYAPADCLGAVGSGTPAMQRHCPLPPGVVWCVVCGAVCRAFLCPISHLRGTCPAGQAHAEDQITIAQRYAAAFGCWAPCALTSQVHAATLYPDLLYEPHEERHERGRRATRRTVLHAGAFALERGPVVARAWTPERRGPRLK